MPSSPALSRWVEQLQSQGRYTFTRGEAEAKTDRSFVAAQSALRRLKKRSRIVSPRRGFYVVIPPEYRTAGSPPASWFIDDLRGRRQPGVSDGWRGADDLTVVGRSCLNWCDDVGEAEVSGVFLDLRK